MRRALLIALSLSGLAWAAAPSGEWRVGLRAAGPIAYGTTLQQAGRLLGPAEVTDVTEGCGYVSFPETPDGTSFMVIDSVLVRFDVHGPGTLTRSGAGVGMTEAEVQALYPGQLTVAPHPYEGPVGHYLVFQPRDAADTAFGLIFETDGLRITSYRAGLHDAVGYIEGCL